ncbi:hypothetical protein ACFXJ8_16340 [Nonomuraea sp. NPDC059194]|uniref:hypothetical protein n=1 Tax=Nonomuraea sp. NPDC059194 TaxID=3346764 RepID=UPI00368D3E6E
MRRIIAGLAAGLVVLAPLPAQAAAPDPAKKPAAVKTPVKKFDPVKALRAQVVPGRGVNVSVVTRMLSDGKQFATFRTSRVVGFRKGGQVDTDDSTTVYSPLAIDPHDPELRFPTLLIKAKGVSYTSGGALIGSLPLDKKWVRDRGYQPTPADLMVDLFRPGTLRALLATASSTGPHSAKGTIDSSKIFGSRSGGRGEKVSWALWFDAKGRVARLTTRFSTRITRDFRLGLSTEARFTGWGARVTVEPPPADLVIERGDLPELELSDESPMRLIDALPNGH